MERYYVDTSVIGGYYDEGFSEWTRLLFDQVLDGKHILVYSDISVRELKNAPERVRNLLNDLIPKENKQFISSNEQSFILAKSYIESGALSPKSFSDAEHIAIASIHTVDAIVSYNFKHMVNFRRIKHYNEINRRFGYPSIDIREPKSLII